MENSTIENKVVEGKTYNAKDLKTLYDKALNAGKKKDRLFKVLEAADKSEQWSVFKKKIRKSQKLPVTNILTRIRDTKEGAFTTEGFVGQFRAKEHRNANTAAQINGYMKYLWTKNNFDDQIGDALNSMLTFGTAISWVTSSGMGTHSKEDQFESSDDLKIHNIDPASLYVDPGASSEKDATYFFIKDATTINYLKTNPKFTDEVSRLEKQIMTNIATKTGAQSYNSSTSTGLAETEIDWITYVGKTLMSDGNYTWDIVYMLGGEIVGKDLNIQPSRCPLVFARENKDRASFWGVSTLKKVLPMQLHLNEVESIIATHASKQQDPIAIVNTRSGLNVADFVKNRDVPGRTFVVNNDAQNAVHYMSLPDLPRDISVMPTRIQEEADKVSGVDSMYTGESSGSLQTAGGISQVLGRSALRDKKPIRSLENYLRNIYILIFEHLKMKQGNYGYNQKDSATNELEYKSIQFAGLNLYDFDLIVDLSTHTQLAKDRNVQYIENLHQQQVQYGPSQPAWEPELITTDEYLEGLRDGDFQSLISKIIHRRQATKDIDMQGIVVQIISSYLQLVQQGADPNEAVMGIGEQYALDPGVLKQFTIAQIIQMNQQNQQMAQQQQAQQSQQGGTPGSNQY